MSRTNAQNQCAERTGQNLLHSNFIVLPRGKFSIELAVDGELATWGYFITNDHAYLLTQIGSKNASKNVNKTT